MIELDFTSDSCVIFLSTGEETAEELGWSIGGSSIENDGGYCYAMIGESMNECADYGMTEAEVDSYACRLRDQIIAEIEAAGLDWTEV